MKKEDKEAIIRRLDAMYGEAKDNETKEALFYAIEALKKDWIPRSERLPDKSGEYYTTCKIKDTKYMCSRFFDAEYRLFASESLVTVLAWMPLPEPYEESDEK